SDAGSANETISIVLSDTNGLLSASGSGITGSGTNRLTISGALSTVNSDLSTLTFFDSGASTDSINIATSDGRGGTDNQLIAVTVFSPLSGQVVLNQATEHLALGSGTTVATFTDSNTSDAASSFTALINWGDGAITTGTIT